MYLFRIAGNEQKLNVDAATPSQVAGTGRQARDRESVAFGGSIACRYG
jgi:hypothetical protein